MFIIIIIIISSFVFNYTELICFNSLVFVKFMIEEILTSIAKKLVENCRFTCEPLTFLYPTI